MLIRWKDIPIRAVCCAAMLAGLVAMPSAVLAIPVVDANPSLATYSNAHEVPVLRVAQNQDAAQVFVRIQQLEEQVRNLTGQVEGLQFQLTQMQTLLERLTEDNEFRFQQLEGGGNTTAPATQQVPAEQSPQGQVEAPAGEPLAGATDTAATAAVGEQPSPDEIEIDPTFSEPMDQVGQSQDPLIASAGQGGSATLGTVPEGDLQGLDAPLDLSLNGGAAPANADANAQYDAGYEALQRGDYAFAEAQFSEFVALYPDDPRAAEAINWLGESLIQLGSFDQAADVLLTGFQQHPESQRAPDLLLKLGVALAGAGEQETACRTFTEVEKRYTDLSPAFQNRLFDEARRAQCQS